jgi:beta-glucosidase
MKKLAVILLLVSFNWLIKAQDYPFQDVSLSEDVRIKNLISLMTIDEKINCLSTRISVPRLTMLTYSIGLIMPWGMM